MRIYWQPLREKKFDTIASAVSSKLQKRKAQDEGWVNFTDNPYNPYFNIASTDGSILKDTSHLPYSSIGSSIFEVEDSNTTEFSDLFTNHSYYDDVLEIDYKTGQIVEKDKYNNLPEYYTLINNSDNEDNDEFGDSSTYDFVDDKHKLNVSAPLFILRKRTGRYGRTWIDRKRTSDKTFMDYMEFGVSESESELESEDDKVSTADTDISMTDTVDKEPFQSKSSPKDEKETSKLEDQPTSKPEDFAEDATVISEGSPKDDSPKDETPEDKTPEDKTLEDKPQKDEAQKDETKRDETPNDETPNDETPNDDTPKDETPKDETPKDETPNDETPKDETSKDETSKDETSHR
ncbi:unnamed protein product [[Candida] boidinii]|uniref:Unnamed protein product n=1 Tax=Candida boidinii TaxID=5477 RepID=A0A9W6T6D5_CANBO|nr:unnamed protein product [[Candida] boidinii]